MRNRENPDQTVTSAVPDDRDGGEARRTCAELLRHTAGSRPHATALTTEKVGLTYSELYAECQRIATALTAHGVGAGDRIAVLSRGSHEYLGLLFAASMTGSMLVGLNFRSHAREILATLDDCRPALLFVDSAFTHLVPEDAPFDVVVIGFGEDADGFAPWVAAASEGAARAEPASDASAVLLMTYTSGSTGVPKGALITEAAYIENSRTYADGFLLRPESRTLLILPLFHIGGISLASAVLYSGGELVLTYDTDPGAVLRAIAEHSITHSALVPPLISAMLAHPDAGTADLSSVEVMLYGAAPNNGSVIDAAMTLLPDCRFCNSYGSTEASGVIAHAPLRRHGDPDPRPGTVGQAPAGVELRIIDPITLEDVDPGQDGEVLVRSKKNVSGYWNRPVETAQLFLPGDWLRTGDIGMIDPDGYLFLKDRLKDVIITGGENVYSVEVENAIAQHPGVLEVAVYGVPDDRWGEAVTAAVVPREPTTTADEIKEFCRSRLSKYKVPRYVDLMPELPKSGSGKILKPALRALASSGATRAR